jgi:hypothetical protein
MPVIPDSSPNVPPLQPVSAMGAVAGAIQRAAQQTGASFEYLLTTAKVESNLNPAARAARSSATGLFQFLEQTWLGVLKSAGQALGFGQYADAISQNATGRYQVTDPAMRQQILQLRSDPAASATLAAALTQNNAAELRQRIGRDPTASELYIAHFFGTAGAGKLIETAATRPGSNAADMFPAAARANRAIFYDRQGQPRSVSGVYAELQRRYQLARANVQTGVPGAVAARPPSPGAPSHVAAPDTAGTTFALAAAQPPADQPKPDFHTLFHSGVERGAVAPVVSELWGRPVRPLFEESRTDLRSLFQDDGSA